MEFMLRNPETVAWRRREDNSIVRMATIALGVIFAVRQVMIFSAHIFAQDKN